jgi:hypothetical protein
MQPNVIRGDSFAFKALVSPPPPQHVIDYFTNNLNTAMTVLGNHNGQFINNVVSLYNKYGSIEAVNNAKYLLDANSGYIENNYIQYVDISNWGNMPPVMQNWVMEHPVVSTLNYRNMCNGFGDTYINTDESTYGKKRVGYMSVMSGILQHDVDGNGIFKHYYFNDDVAKDSSELSIRDKVKIIDVWKNVEILLANGYDPTDLDLNKI